ncbi:hypothetical protein LRS06_18315 [Hymenobacter sp. J193]|uniref:hypothetical protein n=1 Tax=Hymenobacter sp. J193 TaxID=2898429 RepID=UPI002151B8E2|nr:hypothetical protein [Hymenobacter sp. J193]MCR5889691.1 hypothetical protein [Hymenobacter sp. J193]
MIAFTTPVKYNAIVGILVETKIAFGQSSVKVAISGKVGSRELLEQCSKTLSGGVNTVFHTVSGHTLTTKMSEKLPAIPVSVIQPTDFASSNVAISKAALHHKRIFCPKLPA